MRTATNSRVSRIIPSLIAVCLIGVRAEAKWGGGSGTAGSGETSTYVFVPDQSQLVQTGGIASVHWTYSVEGYFELAVDPNAGTASFTRVDANATDDSPFKRTLDPNQVFNMTTLVGTVLEDGTIKLTGKASDGSDILITVALTDDLAHLIGQTTPPPNSADFFIFEIDAVAERKYGGGSGTREDPYQIWTAEQMQAIGADANDWGKHFVLMADIDLSQFDGKDGREKFNVIGEWNSRFTGVFDGNDHTISNFTYDRKDRNFVGLFGWVDDPNAKIADLGMIDPNVAMVGGSGGSLIAYLGDGTVANCYARGGCVVGGLTVGGLVGQCASWEVPRKPPVTFSIDHCYVSGVNVSCIRKMGWPGGEAGGLVGYVGPSIDEGNISNCHVEGACVSGGDCVGGLVGMNFGSIADCNVDADVAGADCVGGLVGKNGDLVWDVDHDYLISGQIVNCCSTGTVAGANSVGGLVGHNGYGEITSAYSAAEVSGEGRDIGGLVGVHGAGWLSKCYSTGTVEGADCVGGLAGSTRGIYVGVIGWENAFISECYSTGSVSADANVGGLVGRNGGTGPDPGGAIINSYWDFEASGEPNMCGFQEERSTGCDPNCGKTTAEMMQQSTFEGWDFINVWGIGENQTYPYLRKYSAADINQDEGVDFGDLAILAEDWLGGIAP